MQYWLSLVSFPESHPWVEIKRLSPFWPQAKFPVVVGLVGVHPVGVECSCCIYWKTVILTAIEREWRLVKMRKVANTHVPVQGPKRQRLVYPLLHMPSSRAIIQGHGAPQVRLEQFLSD